MSGIGRIPQEPSVSSSSAVSQGHKVQGREAGKKTVTGSLKEVRNTPVQKDSKVTIIDSQRVTFGKRISFGEASLSSGAASRDTQPACSYTSFKVAAKQESSVAQDAKGNVTISGAKGLHIGKTKVFNFPAVTKKS